MLTINDIGKISDHEYEAFCNIWGSKTSIYIDISAPDADIGQCLPAINAKLCRLDTGKTELFTALREDGDDIVELAEEWLTSIDPEEDEQGEYYLTNQGEKVRLPIDPQELCDGLKVEGVTVYYDAEDDISLDLFIYCAVDYFAGHCINAGLEPDNCFSVSGLAG